MMRRDRCPPRSNGVDTSHGYIPHLRVAMPGVHLDAPVMLWPHTLFREEKPHPVMSEGRYLHALPGGGRIVGGFPR